MSLLGINTQGIVHEALTNGKHEDALGKCENEPLPEDACTKVLIIGPVCIQEWVLKEDFFSILVIPGGVNYNRPGSEYQVESLSHEGFVEYLARES